MHKANPTVFYGANMGVKLKTTKLMAAMLIGLCMVVAGLAAVWGGLPTRVVGAANGIPISAEPAATFYIGAGGVDDSEANIYNYEFFDEGWNAAVDRAAAAYASDKNSYVKVILRRDWVAEQEGFGTGNGFSDGRIYSPSGTNILLDLNGKTIDRNLSDTQGATNGHVMQISGGLAVIDGTGEGIITGGYNAASATVAGGGISVSGGTFELYGGTITGNKVSGTAVMGIGVSVINGGVFNMYGGTISDHANNSVKNSFGGGVCVYTTGEFNMHGGVIENNSTVFGGGVAAYNVASGTAINIEGGTIRNNKAVAGTSGATHSGGGGICAFNAVNTRISNGDIINNIADNYGGGVYVVASNTAVNFIMSGGNIGNNMVAALDRKIYGGGIVVRRGSSTATVSAYAEMTGGTIDNNTVIGLCENEKLPSGANSYECFGGGAYIYGATYKMSGGEIANNRVCSLTDSAAASENLDITKINLDNENEVCDGYRTYGGGVYIYQPSWTPVAGSLEMSGGAIYNNRATSGGGLNVDGGLYMTGGSIYGNEGLYGGGLYLTAYARVSLAGKPVIEENYSIIKNSGNRLASNLQVAASDARILNIVGAFEEGARIHVFANEGIIKNGTALTKDYGKYNSKVVGGKTVYANPYRFFISDTVYSADGADVDPDSLSEQHIMVLESGELGVATEPLKYTVTYSDNSTQDFVFGEQGAQNAPDWNYIEYTYGDNKIPVSVSAPELDGEPTEAVNNAAGVYTLTVSPGIGNATAEFSVIITAKALTNDDVTISVDDNKYTYDGSEKTPDCAVTYGNVTLIKGTDYTLSYENNVNAGEATAVVTFIGNYSGTATASFTIGTSEEDVSVSVGWQVYDGSEWIDFESSLYATQFTYNGADQSANIRAVLTYGAQIPNQTVYAVGAGESDENRNGSMYLQFKLSGTASAFTDAGTYTVTLLGDGNYDIDDGDRTVSGIVINKKEITLGESDFDYEDGQMRRLWWVYFDVNNFPTSARLLDEVTYVDQDAAPNQFGEKVTVGTLTDSYARYRGTELELKFNGDYVIGGQTLGELLELADSVQYTHVNLTESANGTVGAFGEVNKIRTTAVITFGDNYSISGGNTITLTKEWYIVTIGNNLIMSDGSAITTLELAGWTFGNDDELKGYAFRPEHGNTVFYTYYKNDSNDILRQFALEYSDDTLRAVKNFYEVTTENGKLAADKTQPINDVNYLFTYNNTLKAGTYKIEVLVPQIEPTVGEHTHWWNGETADDLGTVYYEFTYAFLFTVETYSISAGSAPNLGISVTFPVSTVAYNGADNNIAKPVIMLNRKLLAEGEDYELYSSRVDVGSATLVIKGINSLTGEFTLLNAFEIVKAQNSWIGLPSIMRWTYQGFDKEVNLLTATPKLLDDADDLWFKITRDSLGNDTIDDLEHITLDSDGYVSDTVEAALNKLTATVDNGYYYLFAYVNDTDNYYGLSQDPIPFRVFAATNYWAITPGVNTWTEGKYNKDDSPVQAESKYGVASVVITDAKGKIYYDSENGINILESAKAGDYTLKASVNGTTDYSGLDVYTVIFRVFEKAGLPWWATLAITVGTLLVVAAIILILWKKKVFEILTGKIVLAIRTRATVDATIAAVRANKMAEEGRKSVEEAKRREAAEERRAKAEQERNRPAEEKAAILEEKAKQVAERASKIQAQATAMLARAERMRNDTKN